MQAGQSSAPSSAPRRPIRQTRSSFQYLVTSWSTIIELISLYKRLRGFEATIEGEPLPAIEAAASA